MVSVLRSWKGHPIFLRAIQILTAANFPARYVIVGEGPQRSQIESRIRDLHFDSIVSLAGHREDVPEVLRALNVLVMPSTDHEGIPQAGLQALATKTPVIGSDIGGIPEIIKPDQTGRLVPAGNPEALAAAIRDALSDQQTTKRFASAGRELVERHYSLESMLDKVEAVYRRHLGNA
jgi:glycosyltransferase involved in cell wall biosynthesis